MKYGLPLIALTFSLNVLAHDHIIPATPSSFEDFPFSTVSTDGIETLNAQRDRRSLRTFTKVKYAHKSDMDLHLTIIRPELRRVLGETEENSQFPMIVYVPGSAWFKQDMDNGLAQLARFAERGYVVAMVEYRPSPLAPFPAQVEDTKTAIHYMKAHAKQYLGDPNNMIVWGDSSGGHTSAMVGATLDTRDFDDTTKPAITLKAVVDYYGPTAIDKMNEEPSTYDHIQPNSPEGMLLGGVNVLENKDKAKLANPMHYVSSTENMPPYLIVHGDKDRLVPFGQSVMLFETLKKHKQPARMIRLHNADHGRAPYWQDDMLDIVDNFIQRNID
ncbi:alpha/beta hydrolase [Marinomonas balearica]|uniref:Acetyl esterase/lipase n=1 Tax=Marinomonas balearica TaxID=491947 RepID=A0A4R6M7Z7_9GAMM|nr:alpha/beta hydrolase [Marinomonas balearica]TDO97558.1 acetyl esterase/lipase [Marinomonas balearica]